LSDIDPSRSIHVLVEPIRKNTAPAIALGIRYLEELCDCKKDDAILVLPSDHLLEPETVFLRFLEETESHAKGGTPVLFGIGPNKPETGYGYIQIGAKTSGPFYHIQRFVEKPDRERAEQYLSSGEYYWNAGIFVFSPQTFWEEVKLHAPELHATMQGDLSDCLARFPQNPEISIDYAIWEKSKRACVCPLPISWSDIGCWDSVYDVMDKDDNLNVKVGNVLEIDTKASLIFGGHKLIATIGLEDLLIVETPEATCISKKGESQKIKALVESLAKRNSETQNGWGKVKLLYKSEEFQIFSYEISPHGSLSISIPDQTIAHWLVLKGQLQINGLSLHPQESFSSTTQTQSVANVTDLPSELLLIQALS